jgi:hypothetical protein
MVNMIRKLIISGLIASSVLVAGCSSSTVAKPGSSALSAPKVPTTIKGKSLTTAQASKLAKILLKNHESGGATVYADVAFGTAATFHLEGVVDWSNSVGRVVLTTKRSDDVPVPAQTIVWGGSSLFFSVPGLTEALAAQGRNGIMYVERPVDIKTSALDQVITLIATFSSAKIENPLLLRQGDTSFQGTGRVGNRDVDLLRFGRSTYSVAADGFAYRIDTTFRSIQGPIVAIFESHGKQTVPPIDRSHVAQMSEIGTVYNDLVNPKPKGQ